MGLETGQFWIFLATFILSVVVIVWRMGSWAGSVNSRLDSLNSRLDEFNSRLDAFNSRLDEFNSRFDAFNSRLETLEKLAVEFREDIKGLFFAIAPPPVGANSPIQLTEYGEKISSTVNVPEWAGKAAANLSDGVAGKEEFEIYDLCVEHVAEQFQADEDFTRMVKSGAYELGVEPEIVLKVFNVVLRDAVLNLLKSHSDVRHPADSRAQSDTLVKKSDHD